MTPVDTAETTPADAETAEVLESVQSLEAPHRAPEPAAEPATATGRASIGRIGRSRSDEAPVESRPEAPVERGPRLRPSREPEAHATQTRPGA